MISIISGQECRFSNFSEIARSVVDSFDLSQTTLNPNAETGLRTTYLRTVSESKIKPNEVLLDRLIAYNQTRESAIATVGQVEEIPLYWVRQCAIASAFYSLGHKDQAWAILVEAAGAASAFYVAVRATVQMNESGYMTQDEFRTLFAKTGGSKRAEKIRLVELFAIQLFNARKWKSAKEAKTKLWPDVKAKAKQIEWNMYDDTG